MKRPEKTQPLIKGSIATPSLVAGIMNAKYVNGLPLARQEREFARYNLNLSTKTMANWVICCADRYLKLLYGRMKEVFLKSHYIHCDESRIQVLGEPEQEGNTKNWMWVYLTDSYSGTPQMVLFDYERTRAGYHPKTFLGEEFEGYLTCDGYQAYHSLGSKIKVSGCFAHARRRFEAALTPLKKDFTKEQLKETVAHQALTRIGILYKVEELVKDKNPEERYARGWLNYYGIASMKNNMEDINGWLYHRIRMCIWKQWKLPRTKKRNLIKMGVHEYYANMAANCRRGHWYCANLTTVKKAMTKERLINGGFYDLATAYQSVHINY